MDITGKLIRNLDEVRGEGARGPWVKGGFVIETEGDFPRQVAFITFGEDRLAMVKCIPLNTLVTVTFSAESREYNNRWYTDLRCIRVQPAATAMPPAATVYTPEAEQTTPQPTQPFAGVPAADGMNDTDNDLPF